LVQCNCIQNIFDRAVQELPKGVLEHEIQSNGVWNEAIRNGGGKIIAAN